MDLNIGVVNVFTSTFCTNWKLEQPSMGITNKMAQVRSGNFISKEETADYNWKTIVRTEYISVDLEYIENRAQYLRLLTHLTSSNTYIRIVERNHNEFQTPKQAFDSLAIKGLCIEKFNTVWSLSENWIHISPKIYILCSLLLLQSRYCLAITLLVFLVPNSTFTIFLT